MQRLETCRQMMESFLATPIRIWQPDEWDFAYFERCHCLDAGLQPHFTAARMEKICRKMDRSTVYHIEEPLEMQVVLLYLGDALVIIGPYTKHHWDEAESEALLSEQGISASYLNAYKLYRCQYSVLDNDTVMRAAVSFIEMNGGSLSDYTFQSISPEVRRVEKQIQIAEEYTLEHVNRTYALETELQNAVRAGDEKRALETSTKLSTVSGGMVYSQVNNWNTLMSVSIFRTMIRLAAKESGLPAIVVDAISRDYLQRLNSLGRSNSQVRTGELNNEFIHDLCKEIRQMNAHNYSGLVRKAVEYVRLNLGHDLSVSRLAEELDTSSGNLSKHFKAETGVTISQYVMRQRSKKASELLASTQHSVQDISNYVGYIDSNYFVKVFKNEYGMTPSDYRKKHMV